MKKLVLLATLASFAVAPAFAQTAAPATTAPAAKPAVTAPATTAPAAKPMADKMSMPMSAADKKAKSADCSKQADAKGLHGKDRKKFRETCKKG